MRAVLCNPDVLFLLAHAIAEVRYYFPNMCHSREYMDISWGCGWFLATLFVVTNLIGQLGAVAMVLTR